MKYVALVTFRELGRGGHGKLTPEFFIPIFAKIVASYGVLLEECWDDELPSKLDRYRDQPIILVYREIWAATNAEFGARVAQAEKLARECTEQVWHGLTLARLIADKSATNRTLADAGIPVPKLALGDRAPSLVFSNENSASGALAFLVDPGSNLDPARYNTEFVDTVQVYNNKAYFVCLRAMCVGATCTAIYVRARATAEKNASVHNKDTPQDAGLLNHLYWNVVHPRETRIANLCASIAERLGSGFFSHDILPCNSSGKLYVCETGFKFDDRALRIQLGGLGARIPFNDHVASIEAGAHAFVRTVRKMDTNAKLFEPMR
jgi:hypothetical protein